MKRLANTAMLAVILTLLPLSARAAELLIPVGKIVGLQLKTDTITVAAFDETMGKNARNAGLRIGDEIIQINDTPIHTTGDVQDALTKCGETIVLTYRRGEETGSLQMQPLHAEGRPRLGIYLRQGIAGIGTVTWYDPDTHVFGTLGHGVNLPRGGLLEMTVGNAYSAQVVSVKKGKTGTPGQLKGSSAGETPLGTLKKNTASGVFGINPGGWKGEPVPAAQWGELKPGPAVILSTVSGSEPQEYSVEILKIYPGSRSDGRNMLLRVTDPALLDATGGIVQGMSGSPILQDGRLVGAVTHVLVNEPTLGYGIFIQNMLNAAA